MHTIFIICKNVLKVWKNHFVHYHCHFN